MARRDVEELEVATITQQRDGKVSISLPMVGFPKGFQLEPGDHVVIVNEASGLVARPLVNYHEVDAGSAKVSGGILRAQSSEYKVTAQSVGSDKLAGGQTGNVGVWTVETSASGPARVVAVRRPQD